MPVILLLLLSLLCLNVSHILFCYALFLMECSNISILYMNAPIDSFKNLNLFFRTVLVNCKPATSFSITLLIKHHIIENFERFSFVQWQIFGTLYSDFFFVYLKVSFLIWQKVRFHFQCILTKIELKVYAHSL